MTLRLVIFSVYPIEAVLITFCGSLQGKTSTPFWALSHRLHNVHAIRRTTSQPKTEQEALEIFRSEVKRCREGEFDLGNFTSEKGEFLLSCPWKVVSIIPADLENQTVCCYIIVEEDLLWYIDGLDIIEETVDFVLSQSDREVFRLCWSD
jgi:hypothetical protein